jgi:hypothetical protein
MITVLCTGRSEAAEGHADEGAGTARVRSGNRFTLTKTYRNLAERTKVKQRFKK